MSFDINFDRPKFAGDPVVFLRALLSMAASRSRYLVGFDHQDLQWCADVWEQAAIVGRGDRAFAHEQARFQKLCDDLKTGMHEQKRVGIVTLDHANDWPTLKTIRRALYMLERAEIRGIH